jgi:CcmD family protein
MNPETVPDTFAALFWSYTVTWGLLAAYVWSLGARLARLERRLASKNVEGPQ